jgi:hypothetical protein
MFLDKPNAAIALVFPKTLLCRVPGVRAVNRLLRACDNSDRSEDYTMNGRVDRPFSP